MHQDTFPVFLCFTSTTRHHLPWGGRREEFLWRIGYKINTSCNKTGRRAQSTEIAWGRNGMYLINRDSAREALKLPGCRWSLGLKVNRFVDGQLSHIKPDINLSALSYPWPVKASFVFAGLKNSCESATKLNEDDEKICQIFSFIRWHTHHQVISERIMWSGTKVDVKCRRKLPRKVNGKASPFFFFFAEFRISSENHFLPGGSHEKSFHSRLAGWREKQAEGVSFLSLFIDFVGFSRIHQVK